MRAEASAVLVLGKLVRQRRDQQPGRSSSRNSYSARFAIGFIDRLLAAFDTLVQLFPEGQESPEAMIGVFI